MVRKTSIGWFGLAGLLAGVLVGCIPSVGTPKRPTPGSTMNPEITNFSKIKRHQATLWAGKLNQKNGLPVIEDDKQYTLQSGDRVKTDANGEGWLYIDNCQVIYLFQNGELTKSSTSKEDSNSGIIAKLLEGTGIWNNDCASQVVIRTDNAEIRLKGTWVSVTYLPQQQVTVVMVFEGKTDIRAVQGKAGSNLSNPVEVPTGYFYFSQPGDRSGSIANLAPRTPHPFTRLPGLIAGLNLWKWIPRMRDRARMDNIPFPEFLVAQCTVKTPADVTAWRLRSDPVNGSVIGEAANGSSFLAMARNVDSGWIFGKTPQGLAWVANGLACGSNLSQLPAISTQPSFVPQPEPEPEPERESESPTDEPPDEPLYPPDGRQPDWEEQNPWEDNKSGGESPEQGDRPTDRGTGDPIPSTPVPTTTIPASPSPTTTTPTSPSPTTTTSTTPNSPGFYERTPKSMR